jgi:DNA-binding response OmpR family regulator
VILTDFNMPRLNGEAFVRLVRRDPRVRHLPVFVVSSEDDTVSISGWKKPGADAWFDKPVDIQALVRTIRGALRRAPPTGLPPWSDTGPSGRRRLPERV